MTSAPSAGVVLEGKAAPASMVSLANVLLTPEKVVGGPIVVPENMLYETGAAGQQAFNRWLRVNSPMPSMLRSWPRLPLA